MVVHFDGDALVYIAGFAADSRNGPFSHSAHNIKLIINKVLDVLDEDEYRVFLTAKDPAVNFRTEIINNYKANRKKRCKNCWERYVTEMREKYPDLSKSQLVDKLDRDIGTKVTKESYVDKIVTNDGIMKRRFFNCIKCDGPVADTKPVYYNKIRNYLIEKYGAWICTWGETDDWLHGGIAATHDKDIRMIPGKYINLKTYEVSDHSDPGEIWLDETIINVKGKPKLKKDGTPSVTKSLNGFGFKWFCVQMLLGDKTDNIIKPYSGDGDVFIHKLFAPLKNKLEMWKMVELYYNMTDNGDRLWDMAQLLWVARAPRQRGTEEVIYKVIGE